MNHSPRVKLRLYQAHYNISPFALKAWVLGLPSHPIEAWHLNRHQRKFSFQHPLPQVFRIIWVTCGSPSATEVLSVTFPTARGLTYGNVLTRLDLSKWRVYTSGRKPMAFKVTFTSTLPGETVFAIPGNTSHLHTFPFSFWLLPARFTRSPTLNLLLKCSGWGEGVSMAVRSAPSSVN